MVIYCFGPGAGHMPTPLCVPDFLLCTVICMCMCYLDMFYIQLVFFPSWICGLLEEQINKCSETFVPCMVTVGCKGHIL